MTGASPSGQVSELQRKGHKLLQDARRYWKCVDIIVDQMRTLQQCLLECNTQSCSSATMAAARSASETFSECIKAFEKACKPQLRAHIQLLQQTWQKIETAYARYPLSSSSSLSTISTPLNVLNPKEWNTIRKYSHLYKAHNLVAGNLKSYELHDVDVVIEPPTRTINNNGPAVIAPITVPSKINIRRHDHANGSPTPSSPRS
jgi:hypothetical protein